MKKVLTFVLLGLFVAMLFICLSDNGAIIPESEEFTDDFINEELNDDTSTQDKDSASNTQTDNTASTSATSSKGSGNTSKDDNTSSNKGVSSNKGGTSSNKSSTSSGKDNFSSDKNSVSSNKNGVSSNKDGKKPNKDTESSSSRVVITTPEGITIINPTSSTLQQIEQEIQNGETELTSSENKTPIIETEEEKDIKVEIEGEKEKVTITKFETEDYSVWIDKEYFKVNDADPSLVTIKALHNSKVSMLIMKNNFGMDTAPIRYANFLKSENLYTVSEITKVKKPTVKGTKHLTATANGKADEYVSVYFVPYDDISFTVILSCPTEAVEGYGARMESLFREIDFK